ncbi:hypothetical protein [Poseidonibacter antarcticus]|uniref:hypothetical protein n=1 Tax=Poseidonibacter antarcticus TaxID=2478538 RepID=UPI000EF540DD|nr:hypothetical protein [Poseidonibacter antarcticus]
MICKKLILISILFTTNILFAENKEVKTLLEKVNQAPNKKEKKELIEKLKVKLASENKKVREKADAIIEAKKKIPLKIYKQNP